MGGTATLTRETDSLKTLSNYVDQACQSHGRKGIGMVRASCGYMAVVGMEGKMGSPNSKISHVAGVVILIHRRHYGGAWQQAAWHCITTLVATLCGHHYAAL